MGSDPEERPGWSLTRPLPPLDWASAVLGPSQAVHWRRQERGGDGSVNLEEEEEEEKKQCSFDVR